ncbi:hypothetical protein BKA67DRAFT_594956 [Truncatella angustata]|uniref:NAD(P)-binding protein n=1 Tax=Truncatella angustata TaxID=152316 RepID=A0A9P8UD21_9PEZI|nr:uncharacterized protein BKA67DRAFT_594956 [Truncatella angustata]KAH6646627.1 hypothetical protein BKA67DRAFT_594956 [Truncatella angustata]KAH8204176.1 hypothetical protein TruAng_001596 [Truncatella angustata]
MSTYVIAGASRGIGFEMLRQLSSDPKNTVVGLVRNPSSTKEKVSAELSDRSNIHIIAGDLTNYDSLKTAADETSAITGGSLDYLVANAAIISQVDGFSPIGQISPRDAANAFHESIDTNVIGSIYLNNVFLPLILKGKAKKIIAISSGMADVDFINQFDIEIGALYSASKAALNVIVAKFSAQYKKQGVLFIAISPGVVDTGNFNPASLSPQEIEGLQSMFAGFQKYAPNFKGPVARELAVQDVIKVWENASLEKGHGGAFLSHLGNKQWL